MTLLVVLGECAHGAGVRAAAAATTVSAGDLRACAAIESSVDRLACYDRLAGRHAVAAAPAAPATAAPAAVAPAPAAAAPAPAPSAQTFGSYAAEHPKPPPAPAASSLEARVASVGRSVSGHMTVLLEGGALWELDEADPLLAAGETVTLTRATLGSYIMRTPSHRDHRARRLR